MVETDIKNDIPLDNQQLDVNSITDEQFDLIKEALEELKQKEEKEKEDQKKANDEMLKKEEAKKLAVALFEQQKKAEAESNAAITKNNEEVENLKRELAELKAKSQGSKITYTNNNPLNAQIEHATTLEDVEKYATKALSYNTVKQVRNLDSSGNREYIENLVKSRLGLR